MFTVNSIYTDNLYEMNGEIYTETYLTQNGTFSGDIYATNNTVTPIKKAAPWYKLPKDTEIHCRFSQLLAGESIIPLDDKVLLEAETLRWLGEDDDDEEIVSCYHIDKNLAEHLLEHTDLPIFYYAAFDMYILGVTFWGTSWDYVGATFRV